MNEHYTIYKTTTAHTFPLFFFLRCSLILDFRPCRWNYSDCCVHYSEQRRLCSTFSYWTNWACYDPNRVNRLNPCGPSVSLSASVGLKGQRKRFPTLSVWKSRAAAAQIINTVCWFNPLNWMSGGLEMDIIMSVVNRMEACEQIQLCLNYLNPRVFLISIIRIMDIIWSPGGICPHISTLLTNYFLCNYLS